MLSSATVGSPFAFANMNAPCSTACVCSARLRPSIGRVYTATFDGFGYVGFEFLGVAADAGVAGFADCRASFVDFLHHRSDEACELRNLAGEDCPAEIDVAENAIERVLVLVVGRAREKHTCHFRPIVGRRNSEGFLVFEMVEKRTFGDARRVAKVIHRR